MTWIAPTLTGGFDGLAQVSRAPDPVPGVLGCNWHPFTQSQDNDD
jgi:hypothetical protein